MRKICIFTVVLLCVSAIPATAAGDGVHWNGYNLDRETIPNSILIDQNGNNYALHTGSADVNVVAFIFTTCVDICPVITSNLMSAESQLDDVDYQFISITVDPATDTPEVLKEYTDEYGIDWPHLTGDLSDLEDVWLDFEISVDTVVIEPEENVRYEAIFLAKLFKRHKSWNKAISRYHSSNPNKQRKYLKKVYSFWNNLRQKKIIS